MDEQKAATLEDVITWDETHRIQFPVGGTCPSCHGLAWLYVPGRNGQPARTIRDRNLAVQVSLVSHGMRLTHYQGKGEHRISRSQWPRPCTCTCDHDWSHRSPQEFLQVFTCSKCGEVRAADSSD